MSKVDPSSYKQLVDKLNKLEDPDLTTAMELSGIVVENLAKRKVPVDTGQLRNSLKHVAEKQSCVVGTNVDYSIYVEKGTGLYAEDGDGRKEVPWKYQDAEGNWHSTSGQHPQPYLRPALRESEP